MSLINDVLRELDRRHANSKERTGIPSNVRPLPPNDPARSRRLAIFAGIVSIALAGAWFLVADLGGLQQTAPTSAVVPPSSAPLTQGVTTDSSATAPTETRQPAAKVDDSQVIVSAGVVPESPVAKDASTTKPRATAPSAKSSVQLVDRGLKLDTVISLSGQAPSVPTDKSSSAATPVSSASTPISSAASDNWVKAQMLIRAGRAEEAEPLLRKIIELQPTQLAARQALIAILLPARRYADAIPILRAGLAHYPEQTSWAMNLARLYVDGGDYAKGWDVLSLGLPHAQQQPDYLAFAGTILQRLDRPGEAAAQYQAALRMRPDEARWWVGLGISLDSSNHTAEARVAYQRAKSIGNYSPEIAKFIDQKLQ
jgi:MSHA biogenesis protein MshN